MKILRYLPFLVLTGAFALLATRHSDFADDAGNGVVLTRAADRPAAPPMAWQDGLNAPHSLEELRGKVVLVNLWATWCGPCVSEMPDLAVLEQHLGGEHFQVTPIALDQPPLVVQRFLNRSGLKDLPVYIGAAARLPVGVLPTTLIIDPSGRVAWRGVGRRAWTSPEVESTLRALIAEAG